MSHYLKLSFRKRWPLCCLLFCAMACNWQKQKPTLAVAKSDSLVAEQKATIAFKHIRESANIVKSGDLIVRTGKDYTSELMRQLSQNDKTYSHCGIASWENDSLFVYHALGGEFNPDQKLRRDAFLLFCNPYENRGFGIYRYQINEQQQKNIIAVAREFYKQGIMFDMKFDLVTDDRMYCSEFVYKTVKKATHNSVAIVTTTLNHIQFVAVDNLFVNPFCREIQQVSFVKQ
jgi:hypothetical protein